MRQITSVCQLSVEKYARRSSRREQILNVIEVVAFCIELVALIEPYYPKVCKGRQPAGLCFMLLICFLQHRFNLSAP